MRHRRCRRGAAAGLVLLLSGCLSPTPFQPAEHGADGYNVERLEQDRFRIRFAGNEATSAQQVEDSLSYLAAQVTLRNDADYYLLVSDKIDRTSIYDPLGSRGPDDVLHCCRPHPRGATSHEFEATAEIVIVKGSAVRESPAAYDAREVAERLRPRMARGGRRGVY